MCTFGVTPGGPKASFLSSYSELVAALSKWHESVPSADLPPFSVCKVHFPWWRHVLLSLTSCGNLALWFPYSQGTETQHHTTSYRPISLASCAFKVFEHLIYARTAPHVLAQLDECQGGFRWGTDVMTYSLLDTLPLRQHTHTFVAFIDIGWRLRWTMVERRPTAR